MPYKLTWEENPHDENLPVLRELPDGVHERPSHGSGQSYARHGVGLGIK